MAYNLCVERAQQQKPKSLTHRREINENEYRMRWTKKCTSNLLRLNQFQKYFLQ